MDFDISQGRSKTENYLAGCSYASAATATTILATAAANTRGVKIKRWMASTTGGSVSDLKANGQVIVFTANGGVLSLDDTIVTPPGVQVEISNSAGGIVYCWYEVL